jgi:hypothetical protein
MLLEPVGIGDCERELRRVSVRCLTAIHARDVTIRPEY